MTQQEIIERNKEIALMLGKEYKDNWIVINYSNVCGVNPTGKTWQECIFHLDYNWLMEVVEFINNLKIKQQTFYVSIIRSNVWVYQHKNRTTKCPASASGVLPENEFKPLQETLFLVVSDFAKLYNNKEL
jgi:hypothetical protein